MDRFASLRFASASFHGLNSVHCADLSCLNLEHNPNEADTEFNILLLSHRAFHPYIMKISHLWLSRGSGRGQDHFDRFTKLNPWQLISCWNNNLSF